MAQRISKSSKIKTGMSCEYHPVFFAEKTELAIVPVWKSNGELNFVTKEDFNWLIENKTEVVEHITLDVLPLEDLES